MEYYIWVVLSFVFHVSSGLTITPENVAGVNKFTLVCGSTTSVLWKTSGGNQISNGAIVFPNYTNTFQIVLSQYEEYNLECIASNCSEYVGAYQCSDNQNVAYAQVVVLSSTPTCEIPGGYLYLPGDPITVSCQVGYTGPWPPVMSWSTPTGASYSITNTTTANQVSSQLVMTSSTLLNSKPVSMTTFFDQPKAGSINQPGYATNVISYSNTWTSPSFFIQSGSGLSVGAIVGISFAVVIIIVIIILLIVCLVCLPKYKASQEAKAKKEGPPPPTVTADMWNTLDRAAEPSYQMPSSAPTNMDLSRPLPQTHRGEAYIAIIKPEIGKLNRSGVNMSQEHFDLPSPNSTFSYQDNNGFSSFSPKPEPLFLSDTSRSSSGPIPTYTFIASPPPEKGRRRRGDGGSQQVENPNESWSTNGSVHDVFTYPEDQFAVQGQDTLV